MSFDGDPVDLSLSSPASSSESKPSPSTKTSKKKASVLPTFLPPCRVCNAVASGFHYGANTCEACKAFFRRSIGHEDTIKPCSRDGMCANSPGGKISCSDCRHKKCLSVGMTKAGSRKGRYTYEKRTQDTKEIRRMQAKVTVDRHFAVEQCSKTAEMLYSQFKEHFPEQCSFVNNLELINERIRIMLADDGYSGGPLTHPIYSPGETPDGFTEMWFNAISDVLSAECDAPQEEGVTFTRAHDIIFEAWSYQAERVFHNLTAYAKALPGFSELLLDDRIILMKQGRCDTLHVLRHKQVLCDMEAHVHYIPNTGDLILCPMIHFKQMVRELAEDMKRVMRKVQKLQFTLEDISVFLAFVLLASDREGLQRPDQVEALQDKLLPVLEYTLKKNHPDLPNIFADALLLLPVMRENTEINKKSLSHVRDRVRAEATPLLAEMIDV